MRKKYGNKTTQEEILKACLILAERINTKRIVEPELNIKYEKRSEIWNKVSKHDYSTAYKEYRRIYKKAIRNNISTDNVWGE